MRLSPEAINEFKEIYAQVFGEQLSDSQADEAGLRLLRLFSLLTGGRPLDRFSRAISKPPEGTHKSGELR